MKFWSILIILIGTTLSAVAQEETERPPYYIFSIYFGGGNYYITENQKQGLAQFLEEIPDIDQHEISVHGHTDDIGGREYNQWLSEMRCQSTITELLKNFLIREEQISIEEFGELNPVYDNSTWEGKLRNRRVDVIIRPVIL